MSIKNENLNSFGQLWAWGYNNSGQLGDNTTISKISPVQIDGNMRVEIAAGAFHSLARKSDGTLWAWGNNSYGQLGNNTNLIDDTTTRINTPLQIAGNTWAEIVAGDFHSLARKSDGTLWAWGRNDFGQLGDNTTIDNRSQNITTHDGSTIKCQLIETPYEIYKNIQNYDVFLFDEFQFFQTYRLQYDLYNKNSFIKAIETLNFYNKEVFIFGLNFDHKGRMFSIMQELLQNLYAKNVTVLYSKCSVCSERAEYSKRLIDNDAMFLIGGAESYEPRCFKHFFTNQ